jgi:FkbM family methyltransferase
MRRLTDFLEERGILHVDFIKADIEGGELNPLRGAERLFERCRRSSLKTSTSTVGDSDTRAGTSSSF